MSHNAGRTGHAAHRKHRAARYASYKESDRKNVNKAVKLVRHIERYGVNDVGEVRDHAAMEALGKVNLTARKAADKITAARRDASALNSN